VLLVWVAGVLYNWRLKRAGLLGNLIVSLSVGMTFIFGGIAVGNPNQKLVWWFGVIAMLIDLGEEIAADAMDIQGGQLAGSRSVAIIVGQEQALRISAVVFLLVILISSVPFVSGWLGWIYLLPIAIMDGVILHSTARMLSPQCEDRRRHVRWIYLSGLAAILLFILTRMLST
jgi:geranylgeranylglycerol-phosphate geranylgeranyltransferase